MTSFVWRIILCPKFEYNSEQPSYTFDFDTFEEADVAFNTYRSVITLLGQNAFYIVPPFSVEVDN